MTLRRLQRGLAFFYVGLVCPVLMYRHLAAQEWLKAYVLGLTIFGLLVFFPPRPHA